MRLDAFTKQDSAVFFAEAPRSPSYWTVFIRWSRRRPTGWSR
ncbi:MAG: hypothetical protein ACRDTH_19815 [Pseudonocardiaceae bacterium]